MNIQQLYTNGNKFVSWPLRIIYQPINKEIQSDKETTGNKVLIRVPKQLFKHAVDRNKLRRRIREAWRINKHTLNNSYILGIAYMDKERQTLQTIERAIKKTIKRLNETSHT